MRDLRVALRALLKQPGFTTVAVLTIALGVGANSAIFSVVDAVMLRPLPFRDPAAVVSITERTPQFPVLSLSPMNYADLCAAAQAFEACGAFRNTTANLSGGEERPRDRVAARGGRPLRFVRQLVRRRDVGEGSGVARDERGELRHQPGGIERQGPHLGVDRGVLLLAGGEAGHHLRQRGAERADVRRDTAAPGDRRRRRDTADESAHRWAALNRVAHAPLEDHL